MINVHFCFSSMEDGQIAATIVVLGACGLINMEGKSQDLILNFNPLFFFLRFLGIIKQFQFQSLIKDSPKLQIAEKPKTKKSSIDLADLLEIPDPEFDELIQTLNAGLEKFPPELCSEGVNGSYFLKDPQGKVLAIFKPEDEEGESQNNPKKSQIKDKRGILPGEAATREVAAFLLDQENGSRFSVPSTHMVRISDSSLGTDSRGKPRIKTGSLQKFVVNDGAAWDIGAGVFPTEEVHKIGMLDMILFNTDRHEGNILFKREKDSFSLVPIDHGFSLPDHLGGAWFDWINYPQAKKNFSQESLEFIQDFDLEKNVNLLSTHLAVRKECLRVMKISTTLLKKGAAFGLNLYQIGRFASRRNFKELSGLEKIVEECSNGDEETFFSQLEEKIEKALPSLAI